MTEGTRKVGLDLPERVRRSLASAVVSEGVQARVVAVGDRESMRPPQGHVVVAATREEIDTIRGPVRILRRLELYRTRYGPVVRLALSVYPEGGEPLSAGSLLNVSQASGDAALAGLGRQKTLYMHFYHLEDGDLAYAFSKEIPNASEQRAEAKKVLKMARDAYSGIAEERRSFRWAVGLAEKRFELPVPEPDEQA
ncbi:hypothetical protein AVDCRST_MAG82-735 [uncultured Rubrobacteraceae bacterium]|uniref:Uncharacterized protein n=1 Tax=uncultured Rubrobacteraceae bacterium TaxID=349277 RepID=A0A6J4PD11_9ACTN|nr:hypothetical protein AVDCRST_MAG82-735 [uncultured Rubrobacteraceae bacterium]